MQRKPVNPKVAMIKQHLAAHRYADARAVVNSSDDPRAPRWLERIDAEERAYVVTKSRRSQRSCLIWLLVLGLLVVVGVAIYTLLLQPATDRMMATMNAIVTEGAECQRLAEQTGISFDTCMQVDGNLTATADGRGSDTSTLPPSTLVGNEPRPTRTMTPDAK